MGCFWVFVSVLVALFFGMKKRRRRRRRDAEAVRRLPPGPPGWPLVGNLFQLGRKPNESLLRMSKQYGPLMTLRLGMKTAVVVSSPAMAKEILKDNDQVFAGRIVIQAAKCLSYHKNSIIWCQYGPRWRMLRKIFNTHLFSHSRLDSASSTLLRKHHTHNMLKLALDKCKEGKEVDIGQVVFYESMNLMGNMMFGKNMLEGGYPEAEEFREVVWRMMEVGGMANLADFFPVLERIDPQGIIKKMMPCILKIFSLLDKFIQEKLHHQQGDDSKCAKDFLDILLDLTKANSGGLEKFDLHAVKSLLLDVFQAGPHVTATTVEWAMAELMSKPRVLKKAQEEIEREVGMERLVEEEDIERFVYVKAVIKEVLRLHPPAPLLSNRADEECKVGGYVIPKNTHTIINVWALGRDAGSWRKAWEFIPERFIEGDNMLDYKGHHFQLIPFGAGRRICPGLPFAHRVLLFTVSSLIHSFHWTPVPTHEDSPCIDMTEKFGLSLQKALPLKAFATPRLPLSLYNSHSHTTP